MFWEAAALKDIEIKARNTARCTIYIQQFTLPRSVRCVRVCMPLYICSFG